jgi:GH25 family lysozyme M1 (1,4-beta-N-acetylmuramidase)
VGLNRLALAALVVGLASAGAAFGADGPPTHPELDYAGSGRARFHVPKTPAARPAGLPGLDVSSWQGNVDWASVAANGARFAFVKATEGTTYVNPYFGQQYVGAYVAGMVRGAYHFGLPDRSTGAAQAQWFAANGGAWSADGQTLPGALDIEYNPYGPTCYGLSQSAMVSWLTSFVTEYQTLTGRSPVIYSTTNWWQTCTGNYAGFGATVPLWIACWCQSAGALPAGWSTYAFWQWTNQPVDFPGDQDVFNGTQDDLAALANGSGPPPPQPPPAPPPPPLPPPPVTCRVPRVIGMRLARARGLIRRGHCAPGHVRRVRSRAKRAGKVLGQSPRAGTRRPRGSSVNLVVGKRR